MYVDSTTFSQAPRVRQSVVPTLRALARRERVLVRNRRGGLARQTRLGRRPALRPRPQAARAAAAGRARATRDHPGGLQCENTPRRMRVFGTRERFSRDACREEGGGDFSSKNHQSKRGVITPQSGGGKTNTRDGVELF